MAVALLQDVRIGQESDRHQFGAGHKLLHLGVQDAGAQYQHLAPTVGRWRRAQPLQVSALQDPKTGEVSTRPNLLATSGMPA